jgi:hypothetical protein
MTTQGRPPTRAHHRTAKPAVVGREAHDAAREGTAVETSRPYQTRVRAALTRPCPCWVTKKNPPKKPPRLGRQRRPPALRAADSTTSAEVRQRQGWVTQATASRRRLSRSSSSFLWRRPSRHFSRRLRWTTPTRLANTHRSTKTVPPHIVHEDSSEAMMISSARKQVQKAAQGQEFLTTDTTSTKAAQIASRVSRPQMYSKNAQKFFTDAKPQSAQKFSADESFHKPAKFAQRTRGTKKASLRGGPHKSASRFAK